MGSSKLVASRIIRRIPSGLVRLCDLAQERNACHRRTVRSRISPRIQHTAQYRVLVDVLLDAQEHSLTGISRDDLLAGVREKITAATDLETAERLTAPDHFDIDARMKSLNARGVVNRWQDAAKKSMARAGCKGIYDSLTHISEWVSQEPRLQ